jgi:hypothetical protein
LRVPVLYSIESLDPANIVETMNRPVLVHASDMEYYYCKYNRLTTRAYRLYKEFLIAAFLPYWSFNAAPVNSIQVKDEHISAELGINRNHFAYPCFGLQKVPHSTELDKHNIALLTKRLSPGFKDDFLRLSFFDIWAANEDRSHNNYNILLSGSQNGYRLYPIDHEACFNHSDNPNRLIPITYEESLIYSEAFARLFHPAGQVYNTLAGLRGKSYLCKQACRADIDVILAAIPSQWKIDIQSEKKALAGFLFSDEWFDAAWETFETYIGYFVNT